MKKQIRKPFLFFVFLLTTIFLLSFSSCNTTDPPPPTKSPRDFTWSVDTLGLPNTFQTWMSSIWGSSGNDVYTCGHISGNEVGLGDLWHYDGKQWETIDYSKDLEFGGSLQAVHGTSYDNVWVVGYKPWQDAYFNQIEIPYVIQYDGAKWEKHEIDTEHGVYGVYVVDRNEVWACGDGGIIYHYNNRKWELDTIKVPKTNDDFFILYNIIFKNGETYTRGINRTSGSPNYQYYFHKKDEGFWKKLDSFDNNSTERKFGNIFTNNKTPKIMTTIKESIYYWNKTTWENFIDTPTPISEITFNSENNILTTSSLGQVYHFNGTDFKEIYNINDITIRASWSNEDEAFIVGAKVIGNVQKTIVLHGK